MKGIVTYWQWDGATAVALCLLCLAYLALWHGHLSRKAFPFSIAVLLLIICLFSPLQVLSAQYLFSVHMAVHVTLLLLVAPLLVLSLPDKLPRWMDGFFRFITRHIILAWSIGVGIMWFWHVPAVFNSMMMHSHPWHYIIHDAETVSLILSGIIFSYPVIAPTRRQYALTNIVYLFSACVCCSLLGLLITFAPTDIYHHYLSAADPYHLNNIIRNKWQISQTDDQQAAGLIMWVPCCMIYLAASLYLLRQWFDEKEYNNTFDTFTKKSGYER